ncbi:hypothetical protein BXZ70DRAFT_975122 [Cristinia sonorae]|uniref:Uncharacterized protein n=1 Tax=Cristinia sonorae TaxID=1940300 RepID=A0A8K0XNA7_9AGAR|nr:hypothetical protein BXZ70DRAFT_975122 [Cristinia sonorae]
MTDDNTNTVAFPTVSSVSIPRISSPAHPHSSVQSFTHASALEICDLVYGPTPTSWEAIERFYEPSATYENPFITATSRSVIADIHTLSTQLAQVDIPKPVALLFTLFGMERTGRWREPWFRALRVWSEVGDVCESDSFDGHRKTVVEHTLNILLLPGLHPATFLPSGAATPDHLRSSTSTDLSVPHHSYANPDQHTAIGVRVTIPSPLHLKLPIMTRLSFNDAGRITYHRDLWDVKDLLGLVPGMTLTQWITGRLMAQGIRGLVGIGRSVFGGATNPMQVAVRNSGDEEMGSTPAELYAKSVKSTVLRNQGRIAGRTEHDSLA